MRKTFMGVQLRALREQRGLTQAALAEALSLSPSYVNQLENNQRPLSVAVLVRLQSALGVQPQFFSEDDEARLMAQLQEVLTEAGPGPAIPQVEVQALAQQMPALARRVIELHRQAHDARERLDTMAAGLGDRDALAMASPLQSHEEVRDYFSAHGNHIAVLDDRAEAIATELKPLTPLAPLAGHIGHMAEQLEQRLAQRHGIRTETAAAEAPLREYDRRRRLLRLNPDLEPGRRAFQLATQLAFLEVAELIDAAAVGPELRSDEARALARIGLASYFAGALLLPYGAFLAAAEGTQYDIDLLARRFGVSFETVCHRLSTLQRPGARGVPFFFVRVDRAGNISKRQSVTDVHFSRVGGTCPLWTVYEAFQQPGRVLTQLAAMPDGRTYLWVARCIQHGTGGYGSPLRQFAVALGCELRHASRLVYARGIALDDPGAATPIGPGCKVCDRHGCAQRAFPALGRSLAIDENLRTPEPYAGR